jgi:hypothetical protein
MDDIIYKIVKIVVEDELLAIESDRSYLLWLIDHQEGHLVSSRIYELAAGHSIFYAAATSVLRKYNCHIVPDRDFVCKCGRGVQLENDNKSLLDIHTNLRCCRRAGLCIIDPRMNQQLMRCDWVAYIHMPELQMAIYKWNDYVNVYNNYIYTDYWAYNKDDDFRCERYHTYPYRVDVTLHEGMWLPKSTLATATSIPSDVAMIYHICKPNMSICQTDTTDGDCVYKMLWFCEYCHELKFTRTYIYPSGVKSLKSRRELTVLYSYINYERIYNMEEYIDPSIVLTLFCGLPPQLPIRDTRFALE